MKKKLLSVFFAFVLCISFVFPASAESNRLIDDAGLLTDEQFDNISALLDSISESLSFDVVVVTEEAMANSSVEDELYQIHSQLGYRGDCSILLVSMRDRDWGIRSFGYGTTAMNESARAHVGNQIQPMLSDGNYSGAFTNYANLTKQMVEDAKAGKVYKTPYNFGLNIVIALIIGLIVALIVTGSMKSQLKSVRMQSSAASYVVKDSLNLTNAQDLYLYRTVSARKIERNTSSSSSSSNTTSGKF